MNGGIAPERLDLLIFLVAVVFGGLALYRLVLWIREAPLSPDPWDASVADQLGQPDAVAICTRCSTPQPPGQWFCEYCGSAVGDYNNWMPYVYVFSEGEVLRNGVTEKFRANALTIGGYLLFSLYSYLIFAPVYWFFFFRTLKQIRQNEMHQLPTSATG